MQPHPEVTRPLLLPCDACGTTFSLDVPLCIIISVYLHRHFLFCAMCDENDILPMSTYVH